MRKNPIIKHLVCDCVTSIPFTLFLWIDAIFYHKMQVVLCTLKVHLKPFYAIYVIVCTVLSVIILTISDDRLTDLRLMTDRLTTDD